MSDEEKAKLIKLWEAAMPKASSLPIARPLTASSLSSTILPVTPMSGPTSSAFYLSYTYPDELPVLDERTDIEILEDNMRAEIFGTPLDDQGFEEAFKPRSGIASRYATKTIKPGSYGTFKF